MLITTLRLTPHEASLLPGGRLPEHLFVRFGGGPGAARAGNAESADVPDPAAASVEYWLDIADATPEECGALFASLGMAEHDSEICLETQPLPRAEKAGPGYALRLPCRSAWQNGAVYLDVLLLRHALITRHTGGLAPLDKVRHHLLEGDRPAEEGTPGLLGYLLQGIIEAGTADMLQARAAVEALGAGLEAEPASTESRPVRLLKRQVEHLAAQAEEQIFCLALLRGLILGETALTAIHDDVVEAADALNHLQRSLQRLEMRLAGLLAQLDTRLRNRTDQRLRMLTVVSSIFMPLTFITGLYGMNFAAMPGLDAPWGYALVTCVMGAVGIGMVAFFWWKGWFK